MIVFLEHLSTWNMLSCSEQVQKQKYKTHADKTSKTACVQTIMLKHPTRRFSVDELKKKQTENECVCVYGMFT